MIVASLSVERTSEPTLLDANRCGVSDWGGCCNCHGEEGKYESEIELHICWLRGLEAGKSDEGSLELLDWMRV